MLEHDRKSRLFNAVSKRELKFDAAVLRCTTVKSNISLLQTKRSLKTTATSTAAFSQVYSTAEYCAPVWCRSTHTRLIDSVLNDVLRIVTVGLRLIPTNHSPILASIQPVELRVLVSNTLIGYGGKLDSDHIFYE